MPRVHLAVALLKRWLLGTHQGGVSLEHLDAYLDEFTFRFNRRKSRSRGKLASRALFSCSVVVSPGGCCRKHWVVVPDLLATVAGLAAGRNLGFDPFRIAGLAFP
jgi:hypothetical protein